MTNDNSALHDWLQHEHTRKFRRESEARLIVVHMNLISACAVSTDPSVRQRLAEYRAQEELVRTLKGRTLDGSSSGTGQSSPPDPGE